jgi:hypothetical protein
MQSRSEAALVVPLDDTSAAWLTVSDGGSALYHGAGLPVDRLIVRLTLAPTVARRPPVMVSDLWCAGMVSTSALREMPLAAIEAACNQPLFYGAIVDRIRTAVLTVDPLSWWPEDDVLAQFEAPPPASEPVSMRLNVPPGRPKPDAFYAQVAETFARLATCTRKPAPELAEANGVPVTTVHGWVAEARRRGFLPAGERSRQRA